ncbi:hypothetical protein [Natronorubrum daqingense]|uniref:Uncharacterized protein n=1 Tax=Natronorubrum daqingense TaxID=588898 RepID=A0A1N7D0B5_9EURY|nr:hypothetical protein [Natronorubrum daqingense]APX97141.1 hypothetical protein BB347_11205 [Natronorubrum daqingense]SIR69272.1 hypothetical protein SAMN05421809_1975 [Natronorubrum daqingense]
MTPVAILAAFCGAMAVIAIGRLVLDEHRDWVDIGSVLVVIGITVLATFWAALEEGWFSLVGQTALALIGTIIVGAGVAVMVRYWNTAQLSNAS